MRPILFGAAAAKLTLIPIAREIFWGFMAVTTTGCGIVGTVLMLKFLIGLYKAGFG